MRQGRDIISNDQRTYYTWFVGLILILIALFTMPDFSIPLLFFLPKLAVILLMIFSGWMAIIACNKDINGFTAAIKDINILLGGNGQSPQQE